MDFARFGSGDRFARVTLYPPPDSGQGARHEALSWVRALTTLHFMAAVSR